MKGLWIGIGAAAVIAAAAAGYMGMSREATLVASSGPEQVSGPVQGSSFDAPAVRKQEEPAPGAPMAAPAPVSPPPVASMESLTDEEAEKKVASSAAEPARATPEGPATAVLSPGTYVPVKFEVLASFKYEEPRPPLGAKPGTPPPTPIPNQIPQTVTAFNNKPVEIEGYMVPMEVTDEGQVKTFILTKNQPQCCFGDVEAPNEWIDVKMEADKTTDFMLDRPVRVQGKLEVGEKLEDGFLVSLYRMTAEKVND